MGNEFIDADVYLDEFILYTDTGLKAVKHFLSDPANAKKFREENPFNFSECDWCCSSRAARAEFIKFLFTEGYGSIF